MKTLVLEKQAIKQNIAAVKARAGDALIYAVLTGDAHGAGLADMARILRDEGIGQFAVSEPAEAETLRRAGFVDEPILMLRATTNREELEKLADLNVIFTISSTEAGMALNALAENRSTVVEVHIQVDSGMGFGGFLAGEPDKLLAVYRDLPNVAVSGIYTQICAHGISERALQAQLAEFERVVKGVVDAGYETGIVHAAGSYALMNYDEARLDAVRVGSALLGRGRRSKGDGLQCVGYGQAELSEVRWVPAGHTVSGERRVVLRKPARVATIPVGYENGFGIAPPEASGLLAVIRNWFAARRKSVRVNGQRARVIGQIGARETLLDVTKCRCAAGDAVVFDLDPMYARGFKRTYTDGTL